MFEKLELSRMAQAMSSYAGSRMTLIARNVANADTPGFKAMDMPDFASTYAEGGNGAMRTTRPGHLGGTQAETAAVERRSIGASAPNGNSVSLELEMVKAAGVRADYDMSLAIRRNTSEIIRASLGR